MDDLQKMGDPLEDLPADFTGMAIRVSSAHNVVVIISKTDEHAAWVAIKPEVAMEFAIELQKAALEMITNGGMIV